VCIGQVNLLHFLSSSDYKGRKWLPKSGGGGGTYKCGAGGGGPRRRPPSSNPRSKEAPPILPNRGGREAIAPPLLTPLMIMQGRK
jgi:hypothetical protein